MYITSSITEFTLWTLENLILVKASTSDIVSLGHVRDAIKTNLGVLAEGQLVLTSRMQSIGFHYVDLHIRSRSLLQLDIHCL